MYRDVIDIDIPNLTDKSFNLRFSLNFTNVKKADSLDLTSDCNSFDGLLLLNPSSEDGQQQVQENQKML